MHRLATLSLATPRHEDPVPSQEFGTLVLSPAGTPDARIPAAAIRAGAGGIVDLSFCTSAAADIQNATDVVAQVRQLADGPVGVLLDADEPAGDDELLSTLLSGAQAPDLVLFALRGIPDLSDSAALVRQVTAAHAAGAAAFVVATCVEHATAAVDAGADAVVVKGNEARGWVGDEGTFVLLQRVLDAVQLPVWAYGGVGLHTIAACRIAGATGVVLDSQLLLTRESPLPEAVRSAIARMDGSETIVLGGDLAGDLPREAGTLRAYRRPGLAPVETCAALAATLGNDPAMAAQEGAHWRSTVRVLVDWTDTETHLLAVGQDACFAAELAEKFVTVGGVLQALRTAADDALIAIKSANPMAPGSPLAQAHRTRYPLVQGPMTRVSDVAGFAAAVAEGGALPFLALSLLRGPEVDKLLRETRELLGDRPWGVGILGFVPAELRDEQLAVVREIAPPFALIAGGRQALARDLDADGIETYLHVPSSGLLSLFLKDGARRFVFEGRECGGHVGPRTSSCCGTGRSARCSTGFRRTPTRPTTASCWPAASTTRDPRQWQRRSPRHSSHAVSRSVHCAVRRTYSPTRRWRPARSRSSSVRPRSTAPRRHCWKAARDTPPAACRRRSPTTSAPPAATWFGKACRTRKCGNASRH